MDALRTMEVRGLASVEVTQDAQDQYARKVHEHGAAGPCGRPAAATAGTWIPSGEPSAVWPSSAWHYRKWTRRFDVEAYRVTERARVGAPVG